MIFINVNIVFSQNILSPNWKISFADTTKTQNWTSNIDKWKNVNLLLSWESQGYFWKNGTVCIAQEFIIPKEFQSKPIDLSLSLQCNVKQIYINDKHIGGNLPNTFWSERGKQTTYAIADSCLNFGEKNKIAIVVSDLSYTGGISHNFCSIKAKNSTQTNAIKIDFPTTNHFFDTTNKVTFEIKTKADKKGKLSLIIKNDFHDTIINKEFIVEKGESKIIFEDNNLKQNPGFYESTAILNNGSYTGTVEWFTVSPEKIECTKNKVNGFNEYWDKALNELKNIEPNFKLKKEEKLCSDSKTGYIIEMQSIGDLTIRGYYFVPKTKGKHPVVLHVPGYGYGFDYIDGFKNNKEEVAELALCVRGHGISADVFNPLASPSGIWGYKLCSKEENAYKGIYMDCVRAVDFLLSRPEIDTSRIGVEGGSQGGGLTLVTAGLCNDKISAAAFFDPFPSDIRGFMKTRTIIVEELKLHLDYYNNECSFDEMLNTQDLLDTKYFADRIKCPVLFGTALFDDDCPPHVGFAAYNRLKSAKKYKIYPNDSHLGESNYGKDFMQFFKTQFNY